MWIILSNEVQIKIMLIYEYSRIPIQAVISEVLLIRVLVWIFVFTKMS